jgi:hypothetical protein
MILFMFHTNKFVVHLFREREAHDRQYGCVVCVCAEGCVCGVMGMGRSVCVGERRGVCGEWHGPCMRRW